MKPTEFFKWFVVDPETGVRTAPPTRVGCKTSPEDNYFR
jgi:hypothetical protein